MPGMPGMPPQGMPMGAPMGGPMPGAMPGQMGGPMGAPMGGPMGCPMGGAPTQPGYPPYGGQPGSFGQPAPAANDPMWGYFTSIAGQVWVFRIICGPHVLMFNVIYFLFFLKMVEKKQLVTV